jgi:hypothetical protein
MRRFIFGVILLFCLSSANRAHASAIYNFSLPTNGAVSSSFDIQLTFADLLPADGLLVIPVTSPEVTSLTFGTPGFSPVQSVIGLQITPTSTLFGLSLRNAAFAPLLFTVAFPGDFFVFNRTPLTTGTFSSVSGNVVSTLSLATASPVGTLTVTSVPEPSTLLLLGSGLLCIARRRLRNRRSEC